MVLRSSPHSIRRDGWQDIVSLALEPTLCLSVDNHTQCTARSPDRSRPASITAAYYLPLSQCRSGCNLQRPTFMALEIRLVLTCSQISRKERHTLQSSQILFGLGPGVVLLANMTTSPSRHLLINGEYHSRGYLPTLLHLTCEYRLRQRRVYLHHSSLSTSSKSRALPQDSNNAPLRRQRTHKSNAHPFLQHQRKTYSQEQPSAGCFGVRHLPPLR